MHIIFFLLDLSKPQSIQPGHRSGPQIQMCVDTCALEEDRKKYLVKETDEIAASGKGVVKKGQNHNITCQ